MKKEFHDINQFPADEGMLIFGISMSKISNAQSAEKYFEYLQAIDRKIVKTEGIGATFLYADYLYMHTEDVVASQFRKKNVESMIAHKNAFTKIIKKNLEWIPSSFSFITWGQLLLEMREFTSFFSNLQKMYSEDNQFQKYVKQDIEDANREYSDDQINFFLEESLVFYLLSKGVVSLPNDYINHHEKWVLHCYPGKPLRTEIYLYQQNFFELENSGNKYENAYYDLEGKTLYNYLDIDIEHFEW